jgi:hypothetical protein
MPEAGELDPFDLASAPVLEDRFPAGEPEDLEEQDQ